MALKQLCSMVSSSFIERNGKESHNKLPLNLWFWLIRGSGGRGVCQPPFFADIIFEQPLKQNYPETFRHTPPYFKKGLKSFFFISGLLTLPIGWKVFSISIPESPYTSLKSMNAFSPDIHVFILIMKCLNVILSQKYLTRNQTIFLIASNCTKKPSCASPAVTAGLNLKSSIPQIPQTLYPPIAKSPFP